MGDSESVISMGNIGWEKGGVKLREAGIFPLIFCMPFMFFPKVLEGDTQPWVFLTALIALFTFRTNKFFSHRDLFVVALALLAIVIYALRCDDAYGILRNTYIYLAFIVFWIVCQRVPKRYFIVGIRYTVIVWFIIGMYQYLSLKLGYDIHVQGRFLAGRMGPPSLTAEASYYGSLSMIHIMYLLENGMNRNRLYIILAMSSVLISGSLLAMILLIFPLLKLPRKYQIAIMVLLPTLIFLDYFYTKTGVVTRLVSIFESGVTLTGMLHDASLNLRVGHIYYTMIEKLPSSLVWNGSIDFQREYNQYANETGILIETGSNYILPAIGEMIYGGGLVALALLGIIISRSYRGCRDIVSGMQKTAFIVACMLNPITIANLFLVIYVQDRADAK